MLHKPFKYRLLVKVGIAITIYLLIYLIFFSSKTFSKEAWAVADEEGRGDMVSSLINSKILIGLTESEVIELLGKPDRGSSRELLYGTGYKWPGKWLPMNFSYNLSVCLDDAGRVTHAYDHD